MDEVLARFGTGSPERDVEGDELLQFLIWARQHGVLRIVVDGSFTSAKLEPNDVDLIILPAISPGLDQGSTPNWDQTWPFLHVLVAEDESDFNTWATVDFGTDRLGRSKGVLEIML